MGLKPIYNLSDMWNCWCEQNNSLHIYFAFHILDTYFWCAVTLVRACVDAFGVDWGARDAVRDVRGNTAWTPKRPVLGRNAWRVLCEIRLVRGQLRSWRRLEHLVRHQYASVAYSWRFSLFRDAT